MDDEDLVWAVVALHDRTLREPRPPVCYETVHEPAGNPYRTPPRIVVRPAPWTARFRAYMDEAILSAMIMMVKVASSALATWMPPR